MAQSHCEAIEIVILLKAEYYMLNDFENEIAVLKTRLYETWGRL